MCEDYEKIFTFVIELEKLKTVYRKTKVVGQDRYENSAEHSWQVALLAMSLQGYAQQPVNIDRVIMMLLLHDVVEIDTGDKIVYSAAHDDFDNEYAAAQRIFGLLPSPMSEEFLMLWLEHAKNETYDAKFASAMDRLMPMLQNIYNQGQSWRENNIRLQQVLDKNHILADAHPQLWEHVKQKLLQLSAQGYFPADQQS